MNTQKYKTYGYNLTTISEKCVKVCHLSTVQDGYIIHNDIEV